MKFGRILVCVAALLAAFQSNTDTFGYVCAAELRTAFDRG